MRIYFFVLAVFLTGFVSAECNSTQIDVNTANAENLDLLYGIGPAYAQNIIDTRPFNSVDDLIDVPGIGPVTLDKIKSQGLACVDESTIPQSDSGENSPENVENQNDEETPVESNTANETDKEMISATANAVENPKNGSVKTEPQIIKLNSANQKDIKSENSFWNLRDNYALTGLMIFSGVIASLLILKNRTRKNELA